MKYLISYFILSVQTRVVFYNALFISDKPCYMLNSYMWLVAAILYYVDSNSIDDQVE